MTANVGAAVVATMAEAELLKAELMLPAILLNTVTVKMYSRPPSVDWSDDRGMEIEFRVNKGTIPVNHQVCEPSKQADPSALRHDQL